MRVVLTWLGVLFVALGTLGCGGSDPEDNPEFRDTAEDPMQLQMPSQTPPGAKGPAAPPSNP